METAVVKSETGRTELAGADDAIGAVMTASQTERCPMTIDREVDVTIDMNTRTKNDRGHVSVGDSFRFLPL